MRRLDDLHLEAPLDLAPAPWINGLELADSASSGFNLRQTSEQPLYVRRAGAVIWMALELREIAGGWIR